MSEVLISIIIPCYNAEATIDDCLISCLRISGLCPCEIIVVDDGSQDKSIESVLRRKNVKLISQSHQGPAAARNAGVAQARGEYVFFTDSDCLVREDCFEKMMPHFAEFKVVAVAGSYGIANPWSRLSRCIYDEIMLRHRSMPEYPKVFGSYNVAIQKKVFQSLGGFSTLYRNASGEDNDLSYKIIAAGYKIYFEKTALVNHYHPEKIGAYLKSQYRHGYWRALMYLAHPRMAGGDDYTLFKDAVEIPCVYAIVLMTAVIVFDNSLVGILVILAGSFLLLQVSWAWRVSRTRDMIFRTLIFSLRAFARAFGFLFGMFHFLPKFFKPMTRCRQGPRL